MGDMRGTRATYLERRVQRFSLLSIGEDAKSTILYKVKLLCPKPGGIKRANEQRRSNAGGQRPMYVAKWGRTVFQ